jgi:uncharacterized protein YyaL (SSP411 family)
MRHTNRLAGEKSPYLLQHATNPVDWHPWGEEAFERARREDKPIFLSIGYSTCHWCHVMERESFEDGSVAELLNRDFVPIKVDREERPDVDRLYMTAAQAMGLGGGWPLNMFLTPKLEPFYGGTYFPPDTRWGRPGLKQVLSSVRDAWTQRRAEVEHTGGTVLAALDTLDEVETAGDADRETLFADAARHFMQSFDREHGGFGPAPKFPSVVNLNFLLRWWMRDPEAHAEAIEPVLRQLDAMRAGGIHDHVGGGFHRYATDAHWLVPHFEKMLYDQAQLAWIYLEAYQVRGDQAYAATARGILSYVARDLSSSEGGFDSAEDADSEGEEGRFYVWTPAGLDSALGKDDAALVAHHYGVTEQGNFEHGATILSEVHDLEETARRFQISGEEAARRLERARARLLEMRAKRVRPHRDDKVITAWNGLMISAFARGARVLGDEALRARAGRAAEFVWARLWDEGSGRLRRRWREGEATGEGQLDDYAYLALGCLDLYQADHAARWLARAARLTEGMVSRFWDPKEGGFFESPPDDPSIRVRMKDGFDGAEMAGNSIAAHNLVTLGRLLDRREWIEKADRTLDYYARRLAVAPFAMPQMLVAMDAWRAIPRHVVIAGALDDSRTAALVAEYDRRFLPYDVLVVADPGREDDGELATLVPFAESLPARDGKPTAYVCVNYACRLPVTDPAAFAAQLEERPAMTATRSHH